MNYEKLLIKAKEAYNKCATNAEKRRLETIFPELAESEDERIRKALIKIINGIYQDDVDYAFVEDGICYEQLFNWLEKHKYTEEDLDKAYKCADKVQYRCGYEDAKKEIEKASDTVKDSEGELMRKEAIAIIKQYNIICEREGDKCYTADRVIAWLENQSEQKSATIEPKFKVGDWVVYETEEWREVLQIKTIEIEHYTFTDGSSSSFTEEQYMHLWTIDDAKDGDVLLFEGYYNSIVLFQGIGINGKGRINYHCKCDLGNYSFGIQGYVACLGTIEKDAEHYYPATKEQRYLLFQKMEKEGYEWDADKKELRKIKQNHTLSDEDEEKLYLTISLLDAYKKEAYTNDCEECISWLKSLENRL